MRVEERFPRVAALIEEHGQGMADLLAGVPYRSAESLAWDLEAEGVAIGATTIKSYRRWLRAAAEREKA